MKFQNPQTIWTIVLSVIITTVIVSGSFYFWQKAQIDVLRQEIQNLKIQNEQLTSKLNTTTETPNDYQTSTLCTDPPVGTDIGSDVYPIDPKYSTLQFLGQLFTAYKCGPERVSKIFGMDGDDYTLGSGIWLKNNPSQSLINTFKSIGFRCRENNPDASCKEWELLNEVKINELMKLEPYHENFKGDDCIHCG